MAEIALDELRSLLNDRDSFLAAPFDALKAISREVAEPTGEFEDARELVIRSLEYRSDLEHLEPIFSSLAAEVGLFPYAEPAAISEGQLVALEAQRPFGEAEDLVFHQEQGYVYRALMAGDNVILSASTSFGKSLVVDAVLAAREFRNCAVVVPTIALLDETRRRLSRFAQYKLITHSSQAPGERNLFVMTQERLLDYPELPPIDFFVIDEFYKLDLGMDPERSSLLNQAFYRLLRSRGQFYLLGPGIAGITPRGAFEARYIGTSFKTVALDVFRVDPADSERETLVGLCQSLNEPTLIYTRSPARAREIAGWLLQAGVGRPTEELDQAVDWVGSAFEPRWQVALGLAQGIGVHHGRLPRALAHHIVRLFNDGELPFLICTSTLIEGVNTAAKNVIIFDNTIARRGLDLFTFNNIRGRSGRMFRHFVGRVFTFYPDPVSELPIVDMPILSQGDDVPTELLMQLEPEDLTPQSLQRLEPYFESDLLPATVLRENVGVDLESQLEVAREISNRHADLGPLLSWRGPYPTYDQLRTVCELIWVLKGPRTRTSVRSDAQLTFLMNQLAQVQGDVGRAIQAQRNIDREPDEAVEFVLEFVRSWPGHHFPKLALALQRIEEEVLPRFGRRPGDYRSYVGRVDHLFLPPYAAALEEYGLPVQLSARIPRLLDPADSLDEVLDRLRAFDPQSVALSDFELDLLQDVRTAL